VRAHELSEHPAGRLRCIECAASTTDSLGWRAYLTVGDEDAEEVAVYCTACAAREFGGP
jgi:hypothetical protein